MKFLGFVADPGKGDTPKAVENVAEYEIIVEGHLDDHWPIWFDGLKIEALPGGYICISGEFLDQPALHGVLERIRDLNLVVALVKRKSRAMRS